MKRIHLHLVSVLFVWLTLSAEGTGLAQTIITHTTAMPNAEGIVTRMDARTIVLRSGAAPTTVAYEYGEKTLCFDETGAVLSIRQLRMGAFVTLYYTMSGEKMVAARIIVRNSEPNPPLPAVKEIKKTNMAHRIE